MIKQNLYANPKYYDLAFCSFRDTKGEVDVIEECIHRYSRIPVKRVLEIACGPSPNLNELMQRGYEYVGLDINESMINYTRKKYNSLRDKTTFIVADIAKVIFPQEFLLLIEKTKKFEFVGWWNNWDINEPIEKAKKFERPLILVRRI